MSDSKDVQQFVMTGIPAERLQEVEQRLEEDGCTSIEHTLENGGYTVTALCPMRDETE